MFVSNLLSVLPILGAIAVPLSAKPLHRREDVAAQDSSSCPTSVLTSGPIDGQAVPSTGGMK